MTGTGSVRVLKRDGSVDLFDTSKLAGCIWRAMGDGYCYEQAQCLADGVLFYITRSGRWCISSAAVFEMCVKVLAHAHLPEPLARLQAHRQLRRDQRRKLRIRHDAGRVTLWEKGWLASVAMRSWHVSPGVARILAGDIERELICDEPRELPREAVIEILNARMAAYGLADAVPAARS